MRRLWFASAALTFIPLLIHRLDRDTSLSRDGSDPGSACHHRGPRQATTAGPAAGKILDRRWSGVVGHEKEKRGYPGGRRVRSTG
ncbi:hypothetical protein [Aporhodopirellula aestuarii]|uniref:Secreted protein n=1 Tax=Aporhodopirellula aestuarii TaxID=2950107 RepID=A0ABT0U5U2_9BACT|nr:hypothetical protein [Aporhodopirellula aestuarii]MCM2372273.1 hypothetical protein [Aporhodopirellula aestuarii]